jgi:hypothetical protein
MPAHDSVPCRVCLVTREADFLRGNSGSDQVDPRKIAEICEA